MRRLLSLLVLLAGCPGGGSDGSPFDKPDAAPAMPDAPKPPPPPDAPLKGYGQACTAPNQCASGLCIGETAGQFACSVPCNIDAPNDCHDVDGFCVPIGGADHACWGMIDTGNDLDDGILSVGDSATRSVTPLGDADMFQVRLNRLGKIRFTVTPQPSIDVKLEAYGMIGSPIGFANNTAAGMPEVLETDVQQLGSYMFLVVRDVGASTGGYTFSVTKVTTAAAQAPDPTRERATSLLRAP